MSIRIEIQEQPERSRFWAEIEVGGMVARRKDVTSPQSEGLAGMLALVQATYYELVPPPPVVAEPEPALPADVPPEPQPGVGVMVPGDNAGDPDQLSVVATLPYTAADVAAWYEAGDDKPAPEKPAPKRRGRPPKKAPEGE